MGFFSFLSGSRQKKNAQEKQKQPLLTCAKCKKQFTKEHGSYVLGGKVFCCEECCKRGETEEKHDKVCEFC